jgi:hypothetical protein
MLLDRYGAELRESQEWDSMVLRGGPYSFEGSESLIIQDPQEPDPLAQIVYCSRMDLSQQARAGLTRVIGSSSHQIVRRALLHYAEPQRSLVPIGPPDASYLWLPLSSFDLSAHSTMFANSLSEALLTLGIHRLIGETRRQHLNNLLFQPLENALFYGSKQRVPNQRLSFAGLALRVIVTNDLKLGTLESYRRAIGTAGGADTQFVEAVVHDDGPGIAEHFSVARHASERPVYEEDISIEHIRLLQAFELHMSSRPSYMERRINQEAFEPGVGLFAVLNGLKMLNGFMDVRCGRIRQYRWLDTSTRFKVSEPLLHPPATPLSGPLIRGTILRFLIPLSLIPAKR